MFLKDSPFHYWQRKSLILCRLRYFANVCKINYNASAICVTGTRNIRMLKNNVKIDVTVKYIESGVIRAKLIGDIGTSAPYISHLIRINEKIVNGTFLQLMENWGTMSN